MELELPDAPAPDRTTEYGSHPDQVYDVRLPEGTPRATLVLIHGGYWRQEFDRSHVAAQANGFVELGYAVAVIEYRRTGGDGGWPQTGEDVAAAVRAVLADDELPSPCILVGHSAGGHLALWCAATAADHDLQVDGVLALAPVANLKTADSLDLDDGATRALLGGRASEVPEVYAAADPTKLPSPACRVIICHGDADEVVPVDLSRYYCGAHSRADLHIWPGIGHYDWIDPRTPAFGFAVAQTARLRTASSGS